MASENVTSWRIPWKAMTWGLTCGIAALTILFLKVAHPARIWIELQEFPLWLFLMALMCILMAWGVDGYRMQFLCSSTKTVVSWKTATIMVISSNFLTLITPFAAGGAPFIIYVLYRRGMSVAQASAIVIGGGFAAQLGLFSLASIAFSLVNEFPGDISAYVSYIRTAFLLYGLLLIALIIIAFKGEELRRLIGWINIPGGGLVNFQAGFRDLFSDQGRFFIGAYIAGFFYYVFQYSAGFLLLTGFDVAPGQSLLRYGVSVLLGIAPLVSPIPGGAGAAELVAYYVLEDTLPGDALGTFILLWRAVVYYIPVVLGGAVFAHLVLKLARLKQPDPNQTDI